MTSATVAGTTRTFTYSGDGLLATSTRGATTTTYVWSPAGTPSPLLQSGSDKLVYGLGPLYGVRADTTTYTFARDGLGSVRAEVDDSSAVSKSFRYVAFGAPVQSTNGSPSLLGFTGELLDANGLVYLRARWYDPEAGRLLTRDPAVGTARRPTSLNGFAYAEARPTFQTDPLGLDPTVDTALEAATPETASREGAQGECTYVVNGVTVYNNATGLRGFIVGLFSGPEGTTVVKSSEIWSQSIVPNPSNLLRHELGHVAQAREYGLGYLPGYAKEFVGVAITRRTADKQEIYKYHPYEIDANQRAGLPMFWHATGPQ